MYTAFKIVAIAWFMFSCLYISLNRYQSNDFSIETRIQNKDIIDENQDAQHDTICMCGYCEEGYIDSLSLK